MAYMARASYGIEIACCTAIDRISRLDSSNLIHNLTSDHPKRLELGRKVLPEQDVTMYRMSGDFLSASRKAF